ncbi:DUF4097 domain-containing protein [Paenibacillus sp. SYP-B3998]|uniref:DUF4097 domain-containing protein n=1 Tax=Paenibacillus sp. SYP-B3998 TaxID=2678564 RepID=A0A6G4A239_9BACL|nr:DUF4097 domain-containing protein [Paenibacillus sp. SYP-B3998]NEW07891.1 DUF4097 domain-containing protein [Paenibacillus sp. SYP-B3998]
MKTFKLTAFCAIFMLLTVACTSKSTPTSNDAGAGAAKQLELPSTNVTKLIIDNTNGRIEIVGKKDTDKIQADLRLNGGDAKDAKLNLTAGKDGVATLEAAFGGKFLSTGSTSVDVKLTLPEKIPVEIKKTHRDGDINISQLASGVSIENVNGQITLSSIGGLIGITNRDGDINIQNAGADVIIENVNGDIKVANVAGSANIQVGDGTLDIDKVNKDVAILQTGSGQVTVGAVKGKVTRGKK